MYKVIEQQTLGAMGGSRGYQTYTRHKVQVEQEDAKTKAQKSAAEQAADSDKPEEKPKSRVNITDQLLTESGWKMPEDKYAALHPTKAVDLMG
jgi:hypothetical protein